MSNSERKDSGMVGGLLHRLVDRVTGRHDQSDQSGGQQRGAPPRHDDRYHPSRWPRPDGDDRKRDLNQRPDQDNKSR